MRIGIAIDATAVSGLTERRGGPVWQASVPRDGRTLGEALDLLLAGVPRRRFGLRRSALVVFGPTLAQFKALDGVPPGIGAGAASLVVRENASRFFLGSAATVTSAAVLKEGRWWAASLNAAAVAEVADACGRAGIRLIGCAPLGAPSVVVDPLKPAKLARMRAVRRLTLAAVALAGMLVAAVGPGLRFKAQARRDRVEADSLRLRLMPSIGIVARERRAGEALERIRQFNTGTERVTILLGALATTLPDSAATISFRADSVGGMLILLAPPGVPLLSRLAGSTAFGSPRLVGALTRESVAGVPMQRMAVAFKRQPSVPSQQRRLAMGAP